MLTRRHIRVKVLQSLYAFYQTEYSDLEKQEKFLSYSIVKVQDLYALLLQLLVATKSYAATHLVKSKKKHLATDLEKNPSTIFINNKVITLLSDSKLLSEYLKNKKLNFWELDDEYVALIFNTLREKYWYKEFLLKEETNWKEDSDFVIKIYKEVIAPNDKLYDYLEDKNLTWLDDFPLVNTNILKTLGKVSHKNIDTLMGFNTSVYKNEDDKEYSIQLLRKVILNDDELSTIIDNKTPNWDKERIAELDMIILKMGIAEFLYFPTIPVLTSE